MSKVSENSAKLNDIPSCLSVIQVYVWYERRYNREDVFVWNRSHKNHSEFNPALSIPDKRCELVSCLPRELSLLNGIQTLLKGFEACDMWIEV